MYKNLKFLFIIQLIREAIISRCTRYEVLQQYHKDPAIFVKDKYESQSAQDSDTYTYLHTDKAETFTKFERCFQQKIQALQSSVFVIIAYVNVLQLLIHGLLGITNILQRDLCVVPKNYVFTYAIHQPRYKKLPEKSSTPWRFWKSTSKKGLQNWSDPTLQRKREG